ncbi:glycosyltransferase [Pseudidiomarina donghaiensis]|uniref:Glycosyl transferase family 1 domain-containing protein n=1 Tax=Pseudidiomarina donghaiensis TaxID=519452 RepID=A0A432XKU5_9GAMM|nr:glycosyltransferase [Pseudidiomarina donghaiensis]RUO49320.1 hypothetical protein CWE24_02100 [Pseudidiomarina donghaiensis]SFV20984.1 Glycosyltransferase involved in cell wall bisynthesis [Pseudidiomarina donghaiensis]
MKSAIFLGNISSPLAVNRFLILVDELVGYDFLFFDKSTGLSFTGQEIRTRNFKDFSYVGKRTFASKLIDKFVVPFKLLSLMRKGKINLVHVHGASLLLLVFPLYFSKVKLVTTCQGSDIGFGYRFPYSIFTKVLLRRSDVITVKSNQMAFQAKKIVNKIPTLLNWGLSVDFINRGAKNAKDSSKVIRIVSMRSARPLYNIPIIFEAIKYLKCDFGEKVRFTFISLCEPEVDLDLSVADEVALGLSQQECIDELAKAEIMISIPSHDGFSTTIMEALALGVYPIISNIEAYSGEFEDSPYLVQRLDDLSADSLEKVLREVIENIDAIRSASGIRRRFAQENYSYSSQVSIIKEIYDHG